MNDWDQTDTLVVLLMLILAAVCTQDYASLSLWKPAPYTIDNAGAP